MATLKDIRSVPTEGFWYQQPETGMRMDGGSLEGTTKRVLGHREINNLQRATMDECREDIQSQICQRVPSSFCKGCEHPDWVFTTDTVMGAGKSLAEIALQKLSGASPFVDKDEAEYRAGICSKCFHNRNMKGCGMGCNLLEKLRWLFDLTIGERKTSHDEVLSVCEVCSCHSKTIVHYNLEVLEASTTPDKQDAFLATGFCWRG